MMVHLLQSNQQPVFFLHIGPWSYLNFHRRQGSDLSMQTRSSQILIPWLNVKEFLVLQKNFFKAQGAWILVFWGIRNSSLTLNLHFLYPAPGLSDICLSFFCEQ